VLDRDEKRLVTENLEEQVFISADANLLDRVIWNLVSNANDHTEPDDTITVRLTEFGGTVQIEIEDTGCGIAAEDIGTIFDKFSQGGKGGAKYSSGLGLTFCKMAMDLHKGDIEAASERGKGSLFTITLPKL
jgi:two-component system sensor histidine kinase BaeS